MHILSSHLAYLKVLRNLTMKQFYCQSLFLNNNHDRTFCMWNATIGTKSSNWTQFAHARHGLFIQDQPVLENQFLGDSLLRRCLKKKIPKKVLHEITPDLIRFAENVANNIHQLGRECELYPPKFIPQNAWGKRVDDLWTCEAWQRMHDISAEEGLVAIGYEQKYGEWSRLYQISKLYLYSPSAGLYTCPLAMTDGAAKTIQVLGCSNPVFQEAYSCLTTRNPKQFWTSGQWMTERRGGSDVAGGTETVAIPDGQDTYRLYGYKWFTSALDSNMALTLARIADKNGNVIQGTKGLTLFYLETKLCNGQYNGIQIVRLKEKLGTRQVPTAELLLDGTLAYKMSEEGHGVSNISSMLTMTRIHNAISSVAGMRRVLSLARDYSCRRKAFGKLIANYPLHMQTLSRLDVESRGSLLLLIELALWLGKMECGKITEEEQLLMRIMTPVLKLYSAKQCVSVASEGLEAFGGQGYMEDTGLPTILRDAQVTTIWEGTTNILSLDILRSIAKTNGEVLRAFHSNVMSRIKAASENHELQQSCSYIQKALENIMAFAQQNTDKMEIAARDFAYSLARTYIGALLVDNANPLESNEDLVAVQRWCLCQDLSPVCTNQNLQLYSNDSIKQDRSLVMEGYMSDPTFS